MSNAFSKLTRFEIALAACALLVVIVGGFFTSRDTTGLLLNTFLLAISIAAVAFPIAFLLAYLLSKYRVPGAGFWQGCLLVLLFVPLFIQLASWEAGFGRGGWYSTLVSQQLSYPPLDNFRGAVLVHAAAAIPWLFWMSRLGFLSVSRTFEEVASLDANPRQVFMRITLPLILPIALASCLYVLIVASTEITITDRYQYRSYAEVLYNEFVLNDRFDELPLSIAPILVTLVSVAGAGLLMCRILLPRMTHTTIDRVASQQNSNWLVTLAVSAIVSFLFFVPIGNLIYQAGIDVVGDEATGQRVRTWSANKMVGLVSKSPIQYREELAYTAIMSQLSVFVAIVIATLTAWWARGRAVRETAAAVLATTCFVLPGPLIGLGLIWLLNRDSTILAWLYDDTLFAPCAAITVRCFPFIYLTIWFGMRSIPKAVTDAASVDGASKFGTLWHVVLPLLWPSLICAVFIGLAVSIGELSASILLMPPGVTTVSTQIFQLIHYGAEDQLAGLCLSCLAVFVAIAIASRFALKRLLGGNQ